MVLDTESQRQLLIAAIDAANWPGSLAEEIVKLKFAVRQAPIQDQLVVPIPAWVEPA